MDDEEESESVEESEDAPRHIIDAVRHVYVGTTVEAWVAGKIGDYMNAILNDRMRYYTRWNIRKILYELTQRLDCADHACMYLSVNSNRHAECGVRRTHSVVGYNRNPVATTNARNNRYNRANDGGKKGWCLLVYVVLAKCNYTAAALARISDHVATIKGIENKILFIVKYGVEHNVPVRIAEQVMRTGARWYMPAVRQYVDAMKTFSPYVVRNRGRESRKTRPRSSSSVSSHPGAPPPQPLASGAPPCTHDRPHTPEARLCQSNIECFA